MRSGRVLAMALVSLLALPAVTSAQHGHQGRQAGQDSARTMGMGPGMMGQGMMGMMAGPSPGMLLAQKETLKLEPSQVERLEKLQDEMGAQHRSQMEEVAPLMKQVGEAFQSEKPDLSAYKDALSKLAEHHVDMMVETARVSQSALAVLNAQQRSQVRGAMRMMGQMLGGMMPGAGMGMGNCPTTQGG